MSRDQPISPVIGVLVVQEGSGGKSWYFLEWLYVRTASGWQILVRIGWRLLGFPGDHLFLFSHAYLHRTLNTFKTLVVQDWRGGKGWNFLESVGEWKPSYWQILVRIGSRLLGFPGDHIFFSHTHLYTNPQHIWNPRSAGEGRGKGLKFGGEIVCTES